MIRELSEEQFISQISQLNESVVVDFYGEDCRACEMVATWLDMLKDDLKVSVFKIKLSGATSPIAEKFGIFSIPTLVRFEDGIPRDRLTGVFSQDDVQLFITPPISK